MLATIISLSDDDVTIIIMIVVLLGLIGLCSSLITINQNKKHEESKPSQQQVYTPMYPKKEDPKITKKPDKTCIFCGEGMDEKQTFCGKCGRRQD